MQPSNVPDPGNLPFAEARAKLAQAFIRHKTDLGPVAEASDDQAIHDRVEEITAHLMRGLGTAFEERDIDWVVRYSWFIDLIMGMVENRPRRRVDG